MFKGRRFVACSEPSYQHSSRSRSLKSTGSMITLCKQNKVQIVPERCSSPSLKALKNVKKKINSMVCSCCCCTSLKGHLFIGRVSFEHLLEEFSVHRMMQRILVAFLLLRFGICAFRFFAFHCKNGITVENSRIAGALFVRLS